MDLDQFRWTASDVGASLSTANPTVKQDIPRHRQGERFIRGPIPLDWLQASIPLGLKALHVTIALWWLAGMKRTNPVRLTRQALQEFGVTPETARSALSKMERVGIVRVDRRRGRGPDVTLLRLSDQSDAQANGQENRLATQERG